MHRLILASASPQRRGLLRDLHIPFTVSPARVSERSTETRPRKLVDLLALRKARAVAAKNPGTLVLGADTIVVLRGAILGKPRDLADCRRILAGLNGRWHRVYTGVALVDADTGRCWREVAVSRVKARALPDAHLERLVGRHMDKAGAYAVQDADDPFVERIVGPFDNVIGLPLASVRRLLKRASAVRRRP